MRRKTHAGTNSLACNNVYNGVPYAAKTLLGESALKQHKSIFPGLRTGVLIAIVSAAMACSSEKEIQGDPIDGERPLNLVVMTLDTLRADMVGAYGNPDGHTPNLDALAAQGTLFLNTYAPMATTFPSHATMFTGVYPRNHGVRWNGDSLEPQWGTLAETLEDQGYETAAFVSYKAMVSKGGLGQGFQTVSDPVKIPGAETIRAGSKVNDLADDWLKKRPAPFFLWVHYFEAHSPYKVTPYAAEKLEGYDGILADGASSEDLTALKGKWARSPADRAALRALYEGSVREADQLVAEFLTLLDRTGQRDNTLLVVVGDHGQMLGELGVAGHGAMLWEEILRVPFFIIDPRNPSATRRVEERVALVDLFPTLVDLLGIETTSTWQGRSLAKALNGEPLEGKIYYSEVRSMEMNKAKTQEDNQEHLIAVFRGDHKLVLKGGEPTLYNLKYDPMTRRPVGKVGEQTRQELTELGELFKNENPEQFMRPTSILDPDTEKELRALGYIE